MKVIAEIGINHNGDINLALEMIRKAKESGADVVKFQKRTPKLCVPKHQWDIMKTNTPWGDISYIDYKEQIEFGKIEYDKIDRLCNEINIEWTASVWDIPSLKFMMDNYKYRIPFIKIPSAKITDVDLLHAINEYNIEVLISTGMSNRYEVEDCIDALGINLYGILVCNSTYPANPEELDLNYIDYLYENVTHQDVYIGYSGHEIGYLPSVVACSMGAGIIERHFTTDKTLWGTDQSCSLEPHEFKKMCDTFDEIEKIKGSHLPKCYDSELIIKNKLR